MEVAPAMSQSESALSLRRDALALLTLALVLTILLAPMLAAPSGMAPGLPGEDGATQWLHWRVFGARWLRQGIIPLWNPHILCGVPFVGGWQSALFYPPNLLFLAMPPGVAARWSVWLHWQLAALFAYGLARTLGAARPGAWIAGLMFTLGAPNALRVYAGHWGATCAIPWLPLILLAFERILIGPNRVGWTLAGALAVAMQFLAGAPQYAAFSAVAAGLCAAARLLTAPRQSLRPAFFACAALVAMYALGCGLAAVQIVPGLAAASRGARAARVCLAWNNLFSWPPEGMLSLVIPRFFGGADSVYWGRYNLWEMCAYAGAAAVVLALAGLRSGRQALSLGLASLALAALAMGEHTGLFEALAGFGGPFASLRGPAKFLMPLTLCLAMLTGLGVTRCLAAVGSPARSRAAARAAWLAGGLAAALLALTAVCHSSLWIPLQETLSKAMQRQRLQGRLSVEPGVDQKAAQIEISRSALWLGLTAAALVLAARGKTRLASAALPVIVALDMAVFAWPHVAPGRAMFDTAQASVPREIAAWLSAQPGASRVQFASRYVNAAMSAGVDTPEGVEPAPPRLYHEFFRNAIGASPDIPPSIYQFTSCAPAIERWTACRYACLPVPRAMAGRPIPWPVLFRASQMEVLDRPGGPFPRCYVAASAAPGKDGSLEPSAPAGPEPVYTPDGPNAVRILAPDAPSGGGLVVLNAWDPGWRASVDGRPADLLRAHHAFMFIPLSPGRHTVELAYHPPEFKIGALASACALAVALLAALASRARRRTAG